MNSERDMVPVSGNPNVLIPKVAVDNWDVICPGPDEITEPEFVSVKYVCYWKRKDSEGFLFQWAVKKFGFGELTFSRPVGGTRWWCDNECCYQPFPTLALKHWLKTMKWKRSTNTRMMKKRLNVPAIVQEMVDNPDSYTCVWSHDDK